MARTATALILGVLLGATAAWLLRPSSLALPDLGELQPPIIATAPAANAVVTAAAREGGADFYRQLADANPSELAAMIRQAAAEPASTERELALAVLLKRHSELDALGAVRLAREAGVGGMALSAVYGAWARKAPGQALAALSTVENPDAAASVAVALIAALGNDAAAFGRVAAVLAAREGEEPLSSVTARVPAISPAGPVTVVSPRSALGLTALRWADLDPRRASAVARNIDDERLRLTLEAAALRALARIAPDEAFSRLATAGDEPREGAVLGGAFAELARADPERLLASVGHLPMDLRRMALSAALPQLAERDPLAAVRYVEGLPASERPAFIQSVARNYGKRDPSAALAWARSSPATGNLGRDNLVAFVLGGVAEQDPYRALDLALEITATGERMRAVQLVVATGGRDDATAEAIANRLLAIDDPRLQESLTFVASTWSSRSPEGVMRWLLANGQSVSPNVFSQVGQQLAMRDPRTALAHSAQIPAAAREPWLTGVAQGYAQNDPQGAIDWLAQFRTEDWYPRAATNIAMQAARQNGPAAARLVDGLDTEHGGAQMQQLVTMVATNWVNQDPAAAMAWAMDRATPQERMNTIRSVVGSWSNQDPAGARQWTLRQPQGAIRDGALTSILTTTVFRGNGGLDTGLLNAFSTDSARQQAVLQVVQAMAYRNPAEARTLIDAHLTDPALHAQAERTLEAARNDSRQRPPAGIQFSTTR